MYRLRIHGQTSIRLLVVGDTHCRFDHLERMIARELEATPELAAVLHCGDIGIYDPDSPSRLTERERYLLEKHKNPVDLCHPYMEGITSLPIPLFGIPGNHEDFQLVDELEQKRKSLKNFDLFAPGERLTLELDEQTFSIMGLGRILPDELSPRSRHRPKYIPPDALRRTLDEGLTTRPDILLLHEAPRLTTVDRRRKFGSTELLELVEEVAPSMAIFGHMHFEVTSRIGSTEVYGLGYGAVGRYAILEIAPGDRLRLQFRDLSGPAPTPMDCVPAPRDLHSDQRSEAERKRLRRLASVPLPLRRSDIMRHFKLGRLRKKERKHLDRLFAELRRLAVDQGALSESEALEVSKKFLRERGLISDESP